MKYPNFNEEKKLWKMGYKYVVGLDEAGRGPLAGPVTATAVVINSKFKIIDSGVNDSKKLTPKKREEIYNFFKEHPNVKWGIGVVSEKVIDKINILEATKLAIKKAIKDLEKKIDITVGGFLILDGNFAVNSDIPQKSIIKADQKVFSCALASIFAKVRRDRMMEKYHKQYPQYGFNKHKGYGTAYHFKMIEKYGPCKIHRKTFYPINNLYKT
ncbi:MAG: ribonuclease HII [bacterium]|nr:ribonuclease HII [bacterium]